MLCAALVKIRDCQTLKGAMNCIMKKAISLSSLARWHHCDLARSYVSAYCQSDKFIYRLYALMTHRHAFTLSSTKLTQNIMNLFRHSRL